MTFGEAVAITEIMIGADGYCGSCGADLMLNMKGKFPDIDWVAVVLAVSVTNDFSEDDRNDMIETLRDEEI